MHGRCLERAGRGGIGRGMHLEVAKPLREVSGEQLFDEVLAVAVKVPGELDLALQDLLVDAKRVLVVERWEAAWVGGQARVDVRVMLSCKGLEDARPSGAASQQQGMSGVR